jgi:hypothetical protein
LRAFSPDTACDLDGPIVFDVDLGRGLFLDLADHRSTLADDLADLLGVDLDRGDARREVAHVRAGLGHDRGHLVEDLEAGRQGLLETVADDRLVDALDLDVHLQGGDAVPRAGHLEVHVTDRVLLAEDVGQDHEPAVRLADQAHRRAGDGAEIGTPASIRARVEPQVEAIEVEPFDDRHSDTSRMTYGNSSWLGRTGMSARSARLPCPMSRRLGPRIGLFSPVLYGGKL